MPLDGYNRGPWYRGGVPRSYIPPTVFASVGCACCLLGFSPLFILAGGATLGIASNINDSSSKTMSTVGAVILSIGCIMFSTAIIMCLVAVFFAKKQEDRRRADQQNPLVSATPQPPPSSAYPHQPTSGNVYPPAGSYPPQPVISGVAGYYPPSSTAVPPPGNQYPPPNYAQPVPPNAPLQGLLNSDDESKQPLQQKS